MYIVADSKIPLAESAFAQFGQVTILPTQKIDAQTVRDADVLLVRSETKVGASLLEESGVRFVGTATIGTDHVDIDYLKKRHIGFASAPGSNANSVAEYIVAALLTIGERLDFALQGKTLGVVGIGNIGSKVVRIAEALGMSVLQNDPPLARATGAPHFRPLDDLMGADIITLHVPLTNSGADSTFHLFDKTRIAKMKRGSILINTSRGGVAETDALKDALARKHLQASVLDVFENEPTFDAELLSMTAIGTPHIAGYSHDGKVNGTRMLYQAACEFFNLPASWAFGDDLPAPRRGQILLPEKSQNLEIVIRDLVKQCYDIEEDDSRLRKVLSTPRDERGKFFQRLRAEYPLRREFPGTSVVLGSENKRLSDVLGVLGFRVAPLGSHATKSQSH